MALNQQGPRRGGASSAESIRPFDVHLAVQFFSEALSTSFVVADCGRRVARRRRAGPGSAPRPSSPGSRSVPSRPAAHGAAVLPPHGAAPRAGVRQGLSQETGWSAHLQRREGTRLLRRVRWFNPQPDFDRLRRRGMQTDARWPSVATRTNPSSPPARAARPRPSPAASPAPARTSRPAAYTGQRPLPAGPAGSTRPTSRVVLPATPDRRRIPCADRGREVRHRPPTTDEHPARGGQFGSWPCAYDVGRN